MAAAQETAPKKAVVSGGEIVIQGPAGFCVDRDASGQSGTVSFVLLASCVALGGEGKPPEDRAILTASVLPDGPKDAAARDSLRSLASFFTTEAGRAALARDGEARSVQIAEIVAIGDTLLLRARDRAPLAGHRVAPEYWRAILVRKERIISLSVLSLAEAPVDAAAKRRLLDDFVARVLAANR